jgi:hypothetical protein
MLVVTCAMQAARLHSRWVDVQAEVSRTVAEYDAQTSGPTKWLGLTACLQQQYGQMVADFVQRCEAEADKKVGARGGGLGGGRAGGNAACDSRLFHCSCSLGDSRCVWHVQLGCCTGTGNQHLRRLETGNKSHACATLHVLYAAYPAHSNTCVLCACSCHVVDQ